MEGQGAKEGSPTLSNPYTALPRNRACLQPTIQKEFQVDSTVQNKIGHLYFF